MDFDFTELPNNYITSDRQFEMRTPDIASFAALKTKMN